MTTTLFATFDGEVLRPDHPIRLPPNTRVRLIVEAEDTGDAETCSFLDTAEGLNLEGPAGWRITDMSTLDGGGFKWFTEKEHRKPRPR